MLQLQTHTQTQIPQCSSKLQNL